MKSPNTPRAVSGGSVRKPSSHLNAQHAYLAEHRGNVDQGFTSRGQGDVQAGPGPRSQAISPNTGKGY